MKVIHFSHSPAFALRFAVPMVNFLKAQGHEVELWTDCPKREKELLKLLPCETKFVKTSFALNLKKIKEFSPDAIHCHSTKGSLFPLLAGKILKIKHRIYHNHGFPYMGHKGVTRFLLKTLEKINFFLSTKIISVSPSNVDELLKDGLIKNKNEIKIFAKGSAIGIDFDKFSAQEKKKTFFSFLYIGRPFKRKGFPLMISAWNESGLHEKGARLLIAGCLEQELLSLKKKTEGVFALGFVSNIEELLNQSDVIILPSFHEGLPYSLLEAQALKKATIGSDIPGIRSVIEHEKTGLLFEVGNSKDLARQMARLFSNPILCQSLGNAAYERVKNDFSQEKVFDDLKKFYEKLNCQFS